MQRCAPRKPISCTVTACGWRPTSILPRRRAAGPRSWWSRRAGCCRRRRSPSPVRKRIAWRLFQRRALAEAAVIHATGEGEWADIRAAGMVNPVAVIPNGVDLPPPAAGGPAPYRSLAGPHPSEKRAGRPGARLGRTRRSLAGLAAAHRRARRAGPRPGAEGPERPTGPPPAFRRGAALWRRPAGGAARRGPVRAADHGQQLRHDRGRGPGGRNRCHLDPRRAVGWSADPGLGRWIDLGPAPLVEALSRAIRLGGAALQAMGERGRAWMARDFAWDGIAGDMLEVYAWAVHGGACPPRSNSIDFHRHRKRRGPP